MNRAVTPRPTRASTMGMSTARRRAETLRPSRTARDTGTSDTAAPRPAARAFLLLVTTLVLATVMAAEAVTSDTAEQYVEAVAFRAPEQPPNPPPNPEPGPDGCEDG